MRVICINEAWGPVSDGQAPLIGDHDVVSHVIEEGDFIVVDGARMRCPFKAYLLERFGPYEGFCAAHFIEEPNEEEQTEEVTELEKQFA